MLTENEILEILEDNLFSCLRYLISRALEDKKDIISVYSNDMRTRFYQGRIDAFLLVLSNDESERERIRKEGFAKAFEKLRELDLLDDLTPEQVNKIIDSIGVWTRRSY